LFILFRFRLFFATFTLGKVYELARSSENIA
jgi:hypothetical protein